MSPPNEHSQPKNGALTATGTVTVPAADAEGPGELRIRIQATIGAPV